jgi:hypothetical protein
LPLASRRGPRILTGFAAAFLALFLIDAIVFRTGLYPSILDTDGSTGRLELVLAVEKNRALTGGHRILVTGDSRMGLLTPVANRLSPQPGYTFGFIGVAGTRPRCWYYMLRDADPTARRYAAIILPVDDYDDQDTYDDQEEWVADLRYVVGRLRLADVLDFAGSYRSLRGKWQALRGGLFKGVVYSEDFQAFLLNPAARLAYVSRAKRDWPQWADNFEPERRNLKGLSVDWNAWKVTFPEGLTADERRVFENVLLMRPVPQTGRCAVYRRRWFGRIIERYRGTGTRLIFIRLPRGPVLRPDSLVHKTSSSIREFASHPHVTLLDERLFESLERPEFYFDPLHLNAEGAVRFSTMLAQEVRAVLGPPQDAQP